MSSRVCAAVVTSNRKDSLRRCLASLAGQTRFPDRVLVVDNASTDGTRAMLDAEFPGVARLDVKENMGGAGGINAAMRWTHCNKFEWTWVMDDSVEALPGCLEKMLGFADQADVIQVRKRGEGPAASGATSFAQANYCDFHGALIGAKAIEAAGLPDQRYFDSGHDTAWGYVASLRANSICLNYEGVTLHESVAAKSRTTFYLDVRNRFLTREFLTKNGAAPSAQTFLAETSVALLKALSAALETPDRIRNIRAAIDGLRDGLHGRFDRLPAV